MIRYQIRFSHLKQQQQTNGFIFVIYSGRRKQVPRSEKERVSQATPLRAHRGLPQAKCAPKPPSSDSTQPHPHFPQLQGEVQHKGTYIDTR